MPHKCIQQTIPPLWRQGDDATEGKLPDVYTSWQGVQPPMRIQNHFLFSEGFPPQTFTFYYSAVGRLSASGQDCFWDCESHVATEVCKTGREEQRRNNSTGSGNSCGLAQENAQPRVRKHGKHLFILNSLEWRADKTRTTVKLISNTYWEFSKCEKLYIRYFSSLFNSVRWVGLFPFYPWQNWGSAKVRGSSPANRWVILGKNTTCLIPKLMLLSKHRIINISPISMHIKFRVVITSGLEGRRVDEVSTTIYLYCFTSSSVIIQDKNIVQG